MHTTKNIILVPVDFSEQSLIAVDQSYNLAHLTSSEITLINVIVTNKAIWGLFSEKEQTEFESRIRVKLQNLADEIACKSKLKVNVMVEQGKLVESLLNTVQKLNPRFIVIGTRFSGKIKEKIMGSNAMKLIREATCPIVTINGKHHRNGCDNIILPLDLTKETKQKTALAIQLGKYFQSVIHIVSVTTTKDVEVLNRLELQLDFVEKNILKEEMSCTKKMIQINGGNDEIAEALFNYSEEMLGDLIIIMTQQEKEIKDYFIGSLAKEIIQKSTIPVISVIPKRIKD